MHASHRPIATQHVRSIIPCFYNVALAPGARVALHLDVDHAHAPCGCGPPTWVERPFSKYKTGAGPPKDGEMEIYLNGGSRFLVLAENSLFMRLLSKNNLVQKNL